MPNIRRYYENRSLKEFIYLFTCVTGVSGSGKSTLILQTLYHALNLTLNNKARKVPKSFKSYKGVELIDKIIDIDQSPIGRTWVQHHSKAAGGGEAAASRRREDQRRGP